MFLLRLFESHRDYFLPKESAGDESVHAQPPGLMQARLSFVLLLIALGCVVGFAKLPRQPLKRWLEPTVHQPPWWVS